MELEWEKQPLTRSIARSIRSGTRVSRPILDGHRFIYDDLKEMWADPTEHHVVLTHAKDPIWQYWRYTPEGGWELLGTAETRQEAQAAAQAEVSSHEKFDPGTYVVATKDSRTIRVQCLTSDGPATHSAIFSRMGYDVRVEEVS